MRRSWLAAHLVILPALVLTLSLRAEPPAAKEANPVVQGNNQFALAVVHDRRAMVLGQASAAAEWS